VRNFEFHCEIEKNQFVLSWAIVGIFRCPVGWLPLKFCHKESHGILSYWYDWPIGILTLETSTSNEILAGLPHTNNHVKGRGGGHKLCGEGGISYVKW